MIVMVKVGRPGVGSVVGGGVDGGISESEVGESSSTLLPNMFKA